jgi:hypothetical protein
MNSIRDFDHDENARNFCSNTQLHSMNYIQLDSDIDTELYPKDEFNQS